jgi:hypothetical protein
MNRSAAIPSVELEHHPLSYADPSGRLFSWRGELYRGVYPARAAFYHDLFAGGVASALIEKGLIIDAEPTTLTADGFGLVLKCRRLPFVSYPFEWSGEMVRSAALRMLDLQRELLRHGLTLQDGQSWNVLFDGAMPIYVDWGSIAPLPAGPWAAEADFRAFFLYPLQFMEAGQRRIARRLMHDFDCGIRLDEAALLAPPPGRAMRLRRSLRSAVRRIAPAPVRRHVRRVRAALSSPERRPEMTAAESVDRLYEEISSMRLPAATSAWHAYYGKDFPSFTCSAEWTPKHHAVDELLTELAPATVLDVGSNSGWYAQLASRKGARVVAFDTDESSVDQLYSAARRDRQSLLPLVMSFTNPTPGYGVNNRLSSSAAERFRCDVVLALALTHHLVFTGNLRFDHIAAGLAALTRRTLIVEFVPRDDAYVRHWGAARDEWYVQENFIAALAAYFPRISVRPSHPSPRVIVVCSR